MTLLCMLARSVLLTSGDSLPWLFWMAHAALNDRTERLR